MSDIVVFDWDCTITCKHMYKCLAGWDGFVDDMDKWCGEAGAEQRSRASSAATSGQSAFAYFVLRRPTQSFCLQSFRIFNLRAHGAQP
eukprot:SAG31_NODE_16713_length_698_cov_3.382304_1_plen_87_part_10